MPRIKSIYLFVLLAFCYFVFTQASCKYGFKDSAPIPAEVKTFRVNYIENKAQYVNPQLSAAVTERMKQKIIGNTRLRQTNDDNAHYDISGYITQYSISTTGVSGTEATKNRLTVSVHLIFKNTLDDKQNSESDVSYSLDYDADLTLSQVESSESTKITNNLVDAMFNKIFSNW